MFHGRIFLLWVEDRFEEDSATIFAQDEASACTGCLHLSDAALRLAFEHFISGRQHGLANSLGFDLPNRWPEHSDLLVGDFLQGMLDTVFFEASPFGDEWSIRLPSLGPSTRSEELGEGFGPEIGIAFGPGRAPHVLEACGRTPSPRASAMRRQRPQTARMAYANEQESSSHELPEHRPLASRIRSLLASSETSVESAPAGILFSREHSRQPSADSIGGPSRQPSTESIMRVALEASLSSIAVRRGPQRDQCEDHMEPTPMRSTQCSPQMPLRCPTSRREQDPATTPMPARRRLYALKAERRIDPMLSGRAVTYGEMMCSLDRTTQMSTAQLHRHWTKLQTVEDYTASQKQRRCQMSNCPAPIAPPVYGKHTKECPGATHSSPAGGGAHCVRALREALAAESYAGCCSSGTGISCTPSMWSTTASTVAGFSAESWPTAWPQTGSPRSTARPGHLRESSGERRRFTDRDAMTQMSSLLVRGKMRSLAPPWRERS